MMTLTKKMRATKMTTISTKILMPTRRKRTKKMMKMSTKTTMIAMRKMKSSLLLPRRRYQLSSLQKQL